MDTGSSEGVRADTTASAPRTRRTRRPATKPRRVARAAVGPTTTIDANPVGGEPRADPSRPSGGDGLAPWVILLVVPALIAGVAIGRRRGPSTAMRSDWMTWATTPTVPHSFQNEGEALVTATILRHFGAPDWHLLNHVTLPMRDGSTQVDHILVSRFGVFVIETKNRTGFIVGDAKNPQWTQHVGAARHVFQNPIHQNYRHLCAVRELLHFVPPHFVHSLVIFTGESTFSPAPPPGVHHLPDAIEHLRARRRTVLSLEELQFCVGCLETARFAITRETDLQHVASLQRRFGAA